MMTASQTSAPTPTARATTRVTANLLCMASMFIWSAGLPAGQPLVGMLPPLPLAAARLALAALALLPVWALAEGFGALARARWLRGFLIGGSTIGAASLFLVVGQRMTDPVTVAIISAAMPVIGIAIEVLLDGRRVTGGLALGLALSLAGGLVALDRSAGAPGLGLGALLCLGSTVTYTLGSRLTVTAFPELTSLGRTTVTMTGAGLAGLLATGLSALGGGAMADWGQLGTIDWLRLLAFSVGSLGVSQVLWIMSVGKLGIGLAALHINAAPFYVMLITWALGSPWNWMQALGAAIVGLGVLAAQNLLTLSRTR